MKLRLYNDYQRKNKQILNKTLEVLKKFKLPLQVQNSISQTLKQINAKSNRNFSMQSQLKEMMCLLIVEYINKIYSYIYGKQKQKQNERQKQKFRVYNNLKDYLDAIEQNQQQNANASSNTSHPFLYTNTKITQFFLLTKCHLNISLLQLSKRQHLQDITDFIQIGNIFQEKNLWKTMFYKHFRITKYIILALITTQINCQNYEGAIQFINILKNQVNAKELVKNISSQFLFKQYEEDSLRFCCILLQLIYISKILQNGIKKAFQIVQNTFNNLTFFKDRKSYDRNLECVLSEIDKQKIKQIKKTYSPLKINRVDKTTKEFMINRINSYIEKFELHRPLQHQLLKFCKPEQFFSQKNQIILPSLQENYNNKLNSDKQILRQNNFQQKQSLKQKRKISFSSLDKIKVVNKIYAPIPTRQAVQMKIESRKKLQIKRNQQRIKINQKVQEQLILLQKMKRKQTNYPFFQEMIMCKRSCHYAELNNNNNSNHKQSSNQKTKTTKSLKQVVNNQQSDKYSSKQKISNLIDSKSTLKNSGLKQSKRKSSVAKFRKRQSKLLNLQMIQQLQMNLQENKFCLIPQSIKIILIKYFLGFRSYLNYDNYLKLQWPMYAHLKKLQNSQLFLCGNEWVKIIKRIQTPIDYNIILKGFNQYRKIKLCLSQIQNIYELNKLLRIKRNVQKKISMISNLGGQRRLYQINHLCDEKQESLIENRKLKFDILSLQYLKQQSQFKTKITFPVKYKKHKQIIIKKVQSDFFQAMNQSVKIHYDYGSNDLQIQSPNKIIKNMKQIIVFKKSHQQNYHAFYYFFQNNFNQAKDVIQNIQSIKKINYKFSLLSFKRFYLPFQKIQFIQIKLIKGLRNIPIKFIIKLPFGSSFSLKDVVYQSNDIQGFKKSILKRNLFVNNSWNDIILNKYLFDMAHIKVSRKVNLLALHSEKNPFIMMKVYFLFKSNKLITILQKNGQFYFFLISINEAVTIMKRNKYVSKQRSINHQLTSASQHGKQQKSIFSANSNNNQQKLKNDYFKIIQKRWKTANFNFQKQFPVFLLSNFNCELKRFNYYWLDYINQQHCFCFRYPQHIFLIKEKQKIMYMKKIKLRSSLQNYQETYSEFRYKLKQQQNQYKLFLNQFIGPAKLIFQNSQNSQIKGKIKQFTTHNKFKKQIVIINLSQLILFQSKNLNKHINKKWMKNNKMRNRMSKIFLNSIEEHINKKLINNYNIQD